MSSKAYDHQYHLDHKAVRCARASAWNKAHPGRPRGPRASQAKLRKQVIMGYGGFCTCCGENELEFLTIEHLLGDGSKERKALGNYGVYKRLRSLGFPKDNYTVLCMNCNWVQRYGKTCPHARVCTAKWTHANLGTSTICKESTIT